MASQFFHIAYTATPRAIIPAIIQTIGHAQSDVFRSHCPIDASLEVTENPPIAAVFAPVAAAAAICDNLYNPSAPLRVMIPPAAIAATDPKRSIPPIYFVRVGCATANWLIIARPLLSISTKGLSAAPAPPPNVLLKLSHV